MVVHETHRFPFFQGLEGAEDGGVAKTLGDAAGVEREYGTVDDRQFIHESSPPGVGVGAGKCPLVGNAREPQALPP